MTVTKDFSGNLKSYSIWKVAEETILQPSIVNAFFERPCRACFASSSQSSGILVLPGPVFPNLIISIGGLYTFLSHIKWRSSEKHGEKSHANALLSQCHAEAHEIGENKPVQVTYRTASD